MVDDGSGEGSDKAKILMIIDKFIHDLFGGIWVGAMVAIYLLNDKASSLQGTTVVLEFYDVMRVFFWLGIFSMGIISVTGAFWFVHYRSEYRGDLERAKRKILIAKHILLGIIFLAGTYMAYGYTFN
jgi:putative copper export protein